MKKGQGIVEYAVILAIVVGLVVIFFGNITNTLNSYQQNAVNTMAGG